MEDLFYSWYEETTTSVPFPKRGKRKRKEFKLNIDELFHSDLYGTMPIACSTPLPVLAPYCGDAPSRLVSFNEAYASAEERYYSAYINCAFSAFLQRNGVKLIPNVTWSLPDSYSYSWSSMPRYSVVAINCNGIMKHDVSKYLWYRGYREAISVLHPSLIIRFGTRMPCEQSDISLYFINERLKRLRYGR